MTQTVRRPDIHNPYSALFTFRRQPRPYQQIKPHRICGELPPERPLYIVPQPRPWWHYERSVWWHVAYIALLIVVLVLAIQFASGKFEVWIP